MGGALCATFAKGVLRPFLGLKTARNGVATSRGGVAQGVHQQLAVKYCKVICFFFNY